MDNGQCKQQNKYLKCDKSLEEHGAMKIYNKKSSPSEGKFSGKIVFKKFQKELAG